MESMRNHLRQLSAVSVQGEDAANALSQNLKKFGPVSLSRFETIHEGLHFLMPLRSFTTKFLLAEHDHWTLVLTDSKDSNSNVQAYAISRVTNCNAIGIVAQSNRRELQVFEQGQTVREVQSLLDVDRWYYREEGQLQPWEDPTQYTRTPKRGRLSAQTVEHYFELYTGFKIPSWQIEEFSKVIGLARSVHEVQVPIVEFETSWDVA